MTSRSRRGGESRKNNPASGSNNDQANDVHSGSQGTGTSDNSEISHPPARGIFVHDRLKCYPPSKMQIFQDNWAGYLYNRFIKEKMAGN
ncbi:hypothetical protein OROMI_016164 [Orobanche minor]